MSSGQLPEQISLLHALDSIGENIIIADPRYHVVWFNTKAAELLSLVAPLYGLERAEDVIGMNMNHFHHRPEHQQRTMGKLQGSHRVRINIRGSVLTDTVITPIKDDEGGIQGYVIMLMDVTIQAEEDKKKDNLIHALSTPMIRIWDHCVALPLIGEFTQERADAVTIAVLEECAKNRIEYVIIDLSGLSYVDDHIKFYIQKISDCLRLIGSTCILVGMSPKLALTTRQLDRNILVFPTAHAGLKYILSLEKHGGGSSASRFV